MPHNKSHNSSNEDFEDDDFVFKLATTSPKIQDSSLKNNNVNSTSNESIIISKGDDDLSSKSEIIQSKPQSAASVASASNSSVNLRFPQLDAFILEKRKEFDLELGKLSKERLEEFMKQEKAKSETAEDLKENEHEKGSENRNSRNLKNYEKLSREADEKEAKQFEAMKVKALSTWQELKSEYEESLKQMHSEQTIRLSQESQLQDSLRASGSVFNRELFEKVVEKCGKGRRTAYGREKMSRFWEVFDRKFPSESTSSASPAENDQILLSLLGKIN